MPGRIATGHKSYYWYSQLIKSLGFGVSLKYFLTFFLGIISFIITE